MIERTTHEDSYLQRTASAIVAKELVGLWICSNVYPIHEVTVTNRIFEMILQFSRLDRWPKKKRNPNFKTKEHSFTCNIDERFDISCYDGTQRHALDKQHGLGMTKKYQVDSGADASGASALLSTCPEQLLTFASSQLQD